MMAYTCQEVYPVAPTYYETLEVDRKASLDVIEAAYRRLALRYHPDRNSAPDALQRMQNLNNDRRPDNHKGWSIS